ncbi:MAG: helix-turn-helix domain-containing protein, partial [Myxococcales bacterium]|nr:helix-turn-helix domain-containing protein [Myxococcales bacterium]
MSEGYLGPQEVAEHLSVSVRHARRLIRERMPHVVLGRGLVRVSPQAFETFLRRTTEPPTRA